jgi:hypothetical protein
MKGGSARALAWGLTRTQLSGTVESILGRGEHRWDWICVVYASDVYHLRATDRVIYVATLGISWGAWEL